MPTALYRPARPEELPATIELFYTSLAEMYARHGMSTPLPERRTVELHYDYIFRTGIFHVAEIEGELAAICHAIVRDRLWFLSGFWALPHLQGRKIGGPLLARVRAEGERLGASKFFTWSSIDLTAMATYMRVGMLPGYQLLTFTGAPVELPARPAACAVEELSPSSAIELDQRVRETGRAADHTFWLTESGHVGRQVRRDGHVIGYYYINQGLVGPAAWLNAEDAAALLSYACREASAQTTALRLMVPGINHSAIRFALRAGLRLTAYSHLLTTAPIGRMEQYLPSGPSLF